jgi:hypothetical protein
MSGRSSPVGEFPDSGTSDAARYYKRAFWSKENLKFSEPWYRLQKSARITQLDARPTVSTRRQGRQHVRQCERTTPQPHLGCGVLLPLFIIWLDWPSPRMMRFMPGSCPLLVFSRRKELT